ncbi:cold shock domain-containing protein 4-like [Phragmites australis]|uniref:cold shock domain-containing protein 4-like n=1 Tax=Phragmites australis TaxID=29695 RepID=UPI002D78D586|nr:cold shock domain-containing protein 4-like [Phragmites australis]
MVAPVRTALLLLVLLALSAPLASGAAGGGPDGGGFFGMPWFGGPQGGPGFFGGWGEGGPGYRRSAVVPPSTVCAEKGPCHGKRLTCPAKCFSSFSYKDKHGSGGGGGGGCSFDCTKHCVASC